MCVYIYKRMWVEQNRANLWKYGQAPRCSIRLRSTITRERRFSLRFLHGKMIRTADIPCDTSSAVESPLANGDVRFWCTQYRLGSRKKSPNARKGKEDQGSFLLGLDKGAHPNRQNRRSRLMRGRWCFLFALNAFGCLHSSNKLDRAVHFCLRVLPCKPNTLRTPCCCSEVAGGEQAGWLGDCNGYRAPSAIGGAIGRPYLAPSGSTHRWEFNFLILNHVGSSTTRLWCYSV